MFHRVKSDVQKTQPSVASNVAEAPQVAQKEKTAPAAEPQESLIVASKAQIQAQASQEQPTPKKESVMSEDNKPTEDRTSVDAAESFSPAKPADIPVAGYQQQPARPASPYTNPAYPGYSAAGMSAPQQAAAQQAQQQASAAAREKAEVERRLVIGQGISMSGQIESCDYLLVEGTIEAALKGARLLEVSETGNFYGTVEIDEATIAGRFEGDLTVNGRLSVKAGGIIMGSISYKELEIEAGALIDGKLSPLRAGGDLSEKKPVRAKAAGSAPSKASKTDAPHQPANNDGQLFSGIASAAE